MTSPLSTGPFCVPLSTTESSVGVSDLSVFLAIRMKLTPQELFWSLHYRFSSNFPKYFRNILLCLDVPRPTRICRASYLCQRYVDMKGKNKQSQIPPVMFLGISQGNMVFEPNFCGIRTPTFMAYEPRLLCHMSRIASKPVENEGRNRRFKSLQFQIGGRLDFNR